MACLADFGGRGGVAEVLEDSGDLGRFWPQKILRRPKGLGLGTVLINKPLIHGTRLCLQGNPQMEAISQAGSICEAKISESGVLRGENRVRDHPYGGISHAR